MKFGQCSKVYCVANDTYVQCTIHMYDTYTQCTKRENWTKPKTNIPMRGT